MARRGGVDRVSVVPHQSLGGGWRIRDIFIVPVPILFFARIILGLFRHWRITIPTAIGLYAAYTLHNAPVGVFVILALFLIYYTFQFFRLYRQHSTIPLKGTFLGFIHILRFRRNWEDSARAAKLGHPRNHNRWKAPPIRSIEIADPRGTSIRARLDLGRTGNTCDELERNKDRLLAILDARTATVQRVRPGMAFFTVNWQDRLSPALDPLYGSADGTTDQPLEIDIDVAQEGKAIISLDKSILIGGETGSGKSNNIWAFLAKLNLLQVPYRLHVADPVGGVELDELENGPYTQEYVDRAALVEPMARQFHQSMNSRLARMKAQGTRRHFPTPDEPLEILIIDELIVLREVIKQGTNGPVGDTLATGRKAGFVIWANSQLGQKEVIGPIRDLFPQRICMRTRTDELTDTILGTKATADGAACHRLTRPGDGYVFTDELNAFVAFHAPLITHTRSVANGGVPLDPPSVLRQTYRQRKLARNPDSEGRTFVYQLFDTSARGIPPCYVGIASNPNRRFKEHQDDKVWFHTIIHQRSIITAYPTRAEAKRVETQLIEKFNPKYNVQERTQ
jgi:hypothetical protein